MRKLKNAVLTAVLTAVFWIPAMAQETPSATRLTTEHFFDLERISSPQISPDGARIVYTRQQANQVTDNWDSMLWTMNADGSQHRFLAKGGKLPLSRRPIDLTQRFDRHILGRIERCARQSEGAPMQPAPIPGHGAVA